MCVQQVYTVKPPCDQTAHIDFLKTKVWGVVRVVAWGDFRWEI